MHKKLLTFAAATGALLIGGCGNPPGNGNEAASSPSSKLVDAQAPKPTPENTVAIVNGKPISKATFQALMNEVMQRSGGQPVPEDKVLEGLIARELLNQEAEKQSLAKEPAVAAKLENARRDVLVQAAVEHFRKTANVSDEEVKKEYDARTAEMKNTEYKARHILLDSEQAAKDAIDKLHKGAKFEELAKKLSKDPGSKQTGGDLGWFNPHQMVPEFSAAVAGLKDGETTPAPVKSQFGWHVILREGARDQEPPPFDAVKDQFRNMLAGQKLQKHVEDLKAAAKIERLAPPKAEAAPAPEAAPAQAGQPEAPPSPEAKPAPAQPPAGDAPKAVPAEAGKPVPPPPPAKK